MCCSDYNSVFVLQVRSLSVATGKVVTKSLHALMNFPGTGALTRVKRSLCVLCATGASCEATIWPSTPAVTWPPSGPQHGPPKSVSSTKWLPPKHHHHSLLWLSVSFYLPQIRPILRPTSHLRTISHWPFYRGNRKPRLLHLHVQNRLTLHWISFLFFYHGHL